MRFSGAFNGACLIVVSWGDKVGKVEIVGGQLVKKPDEVVGWFWFSVCEGGFGGKKR